MSNFDPPGIGHNQPPDDIELLREKLDAQTLDLQRRVDDLKTAEARLPEITDDASAGDAADFVKMATAAIKDADAKRVDAKEPFLKAGRAVDGFFKGLSDPLDSLRRRVEQRITVYLRAKEARERAAREAEAKRLRDEAEAREREARRLERARLDDEAARRRQEAAASAAEAAAVEAKTEKAKPADLSRTRGDMGSVASLRRAWVGTITDVRKVDLEALRPYIRPDALQKALNLAVQAGVREIAGCTIEETTMANVR